MLVSGESASDDKSLRIRLPEPDAEAVSVTLDGFSVVSLPRLIELKIASGLGNLRRTHRDFADVIELILVHNLSRQFARELHRSVRPAFRGLVLQARGAERNNCMTGWIVGAARDKKGRPMYMKLADELIAAHKRGPTSFGPAPLTSTDFQD